MNDATLIFGKYHSAGMVARRFLQKENGQSLHLSTVIRWITRGLNIDGQRVRLKAYRAGRQWFIDPADLEVFISQTTPKLDEPANLPRSVGKRNRNSHRAAKAAAAV